MPPPRDRLADMKENAYIEEGDDFEINVDDEGPVKDFLKEIEEIKNNVEKVNAKIEEVKKLQSEILTNPTVDKKQNQQMDDLMAEIKKLANNVRSRLKKIETENEAEETGKGSVSGELRIKKTQHMTTSRWGCSMFTFLDSKMFCCNCIFSTLQNVKISSCLQPLA